MMKWHVGGITLLTLAFAFTQTPQYQLWQWTQRYTSAAEAQERLKTNPNDVKAHRTLAWRMFGPGASRQDVTQARREWEEVIRCDPSDQFAVIILAPMLIPGSQQDKEQARRLLTPIADHGNTRLRDEARYMLRKLGASVS